LEKFKIGAILVQRIGILYNWKGQTLSLKQEKGGFRHGEETGREKGGESGKRVRA